MSTRSASRQPAFVYQEVLSATRHLQGAYDSEKCQFCRHDIGLVLDATKDLERIAEWAQNLSDHPHRLKAIRTLAANLDRLKVLSLLVTLYKNKVIRGILLMGSRDERRD